MIRQSLALTEGKEMKYTRTMLVAAAATVWCAQASARAEPIGTALTYQGQLKQGGVPVDGQANFVFGVESGLSWRPKRSLELDLVGAIGDALGRASSAPAFRLWLGMTYRW